MNLSSLALQSETPLPSPGSGRSPVWLRFALIGTLFLLAAIWLEPYMLPLSRLTADQVHLLLSLSGYAPQQQGVLITLSGFTVRIVTECTPLYACLLFGAFVLAQPSSPLRTLAGLLSGVLVITAVNLLRITFVTAAGPVVSPFAFDVLHVYLGQVVMLILVLAAALLWLRWNSGGPSPFPFLVRAVLIATALFVPWVVVNRAYLALLDSVVAHLFRLLIPDSYLLTPRPLALYNHTFAIPLFLALVLASRSSWSVNRFAATVAGCYAIAGWHLLFRVTHVLWTACDLPEVAPLHQGVYLLGQFMIPFLSWMWQERSGRHCQV